MIKRAARRDNFAVISQSIFADRQLSAEGLGILVYLLSKPDNWTVRAAELAARFGCSENRIYRILAKIRSAGYASFQRSASGKTDWTITENPHTQNGDEGIRQPHTQKPNEEKPNEGFGDVLVNTESAVNTDNSTSTDKPYRSNAALFDRWWDSYPKKVAKKTAQSIWKRRKLDEIAHRLIQDVENRKANCGKWAGGYIPNPTTYLNQDRWEDEIESCRPARKETSADRQLRIIKGSL